MSHQRFPVAAFLHFTVASDDEDPGAAVQELGADGCSDDGQGLA